MAYNKLSTYKTAWTEDGHGVGSVIYTSTAIVSWDNDTITLRSGGWETVTTKRKMNQASHQFGLGFGVYQRNHVWYVDMPDGDTVLFTDSLILKREQLKTTMTMKTNILICLTQHNLKLVKPLIGLKHNMFKQCNIFVWVSWRI